MNDYDINKVVKAFMDVLEGRHSWHDIQADTGLPEARCRAIEELYKELFHKLERGTK